MSGYHYWVPLTGSLDTTKTSKFPLVSKSLITLLKSSVTASTRFQRAVSFAFVSSFWSGTQSVHVFAARHLSSENFRTNPCSSNYRPQRSCGQGNIFTPVCHSVHRGVSASVTTPPRETPREQTPPPGADTPQERTPPRSRHPPGADTPQKHPPWEATPPGSRLRHTVNERPVRILLECILVPVLFGQNLFKFRKFGFIQPSISVFSISTMFLFI